LKEVRPLSPIRLGKTSALPRCFLSQATGV
jgi:hypothetical protein